MNKMKLPPSLIPFAVISGLLIIFGIICISINEFTKTSRETVCRNDISYDKVMDVEYSNCMNAFHSKCSDHNHEVTSSCICSLLHKQNATLEGDIVLMYRLDEINETWFSSRDDEQLSGTLKADVSPACGEYSYDANNKTIAPCGALANFIFTDTVGVHYMNTSEGTVIPRVSYGLLKQVNKTGFRNPPNKNISEAFKGFALPPRWELINKDIRKLDEHNEDNNGFQNEAFISWMATPSRSPKLFWRLNRTAQSYLPEGDYQFRVIYRYPYKMYSGKRTLILAKERVDESCVVVTLPLYPRKLITVGLVVVVLGILVFVIPTIVYCIKQKGSKESNPPNTPHRDEEEEEARHLTHRHTIPNVELHPTNSTSRHTYPN